MCHRLVGPTAAARLGSLPGLCGLDLGGSLVHFLKASFFFPFKNNNSFGIILHLQGHLQCRFLMLGTEDTGVALQSWSTTPMDGFCSSPPRQPQLLPHLGRRTLIITIIITHNITFPCLHLFFFCNFNESFEIRSWFSSQHVLGVSSLPFLYPSPVFLGERLSGRAICSRNVDYKTFSLLLTTGPPLLLG